MPTLSPRRTLAAFLALTALALATVAPAQSTALIPVFKTGDTIPAEPPLAISTIDEAYIGPAGDIVAEIFAPGNIRALVHAHADTPNVHRVFARVGQLAPGLSGGVEFAAFDSFIPDNAGRVLFKAALRQGGTEVITSTNDRGFWLFDSATGQVTKLLREGEPAPGIASAQFNFLAEESFAGGHLIFRTTLFDAGSSITNGISVWTLSVGAPTPTLVARVGSPSPVAGSVFKSFEKLLIAASGVSVLDVGIGPASGSSIDSVIRRSADGSLVHLLSVGGTAPGVPPPTTISLLSVLSLSPEGSPIVLANLSGASSDRALCLLSSGSNQTLLARTGNAIPGVSPALTMSDFGFVGAGAAGAVHFTTAVGGTGVTSANDRANILRTSSNNTIALREGDAAPELGGLLFGSSDPANFAARTTTNSAGMLLLQTTVITSPTFASVMYLFDPAAPAGSRLKLIAEPGHPLVISPTTTLLSTSCRADGFGGTSEGRARALSDRGEAVLHMTFGSAGSALMLYSPTAASTTGACCIGATCQILSAAACTAPGRSFSGPGTVCNAPANLTTPCCKADFDQSGTLTPQDIFEFLNAWFQGLPSADIDATNALQPADIFAFLNAWFTGC